MMTLWRHIVDGTLSRRKETWKLICSCLDVSFGHPPCQNRLRLLSGTPSVLLDSMMTIWRHIGQEAIPRQLEPWKLIQTFVEAFKVHPLCQKPPTLLSGITSVLLDSMDDTWMMFWRTQEFDHFPGGKRLENGYVASLMDPCGINHIKIYQDCSQEPPASS